MGHCHAKVTQPTTDEVFSKLEVPSVLARAEELVRRYPVPRSALLPMLWLAQETIGWLPQEAIRWAAGKCDVSPVHAYGVSMFYTMYKKEPTGRFFLQICQNVSCHVLGAEDIIAHAESTLGISSKGGTTSDDLFTLLRVECLGACGNGPVMQVNDDFATDVVAGALAMPAGVQLTKERFDRIVAWCRDRAAKLPQEPLRDVSGGAFRTGGHPGAKGATTSPQRPDYAPAPPVLALSVQKTEDGKAKVTWRADGAVTALHLEARRDGGAFAPVATLSGKDKEWVGEFAAGTELRMVSESQGRRAKPSNIAKMEA
ncbi:MAG TPA: NAD(P)H-dependent oxidoreductase subunit E [Fibrobacteria bacterium]|nr:NAD(P)H-dependent oxidoreductase subunit E [Fibrobacteria bacterium]HOX53459.1 NAD(P)H-dependent oxidoreductase subunit E [Fibrobacteria bacterium]